MTPAKRKQLLKTLEIDHWVRRDTPAPQTFTHSESPADVSEPVSAAAGPTSVEKRGRGRPRIHPVPGAATAATPAPALSPVAHVPALQPIDMPQDWVGIRALVRDCTRCKLCETRTQTVFGVGVENAQLMVVGEGPGADEDAQGEPFVGRAGKLLDEMLRSIGRSRQDNVFIANVVKCRPPGNRDPEPVEAEACRPYLEQQIKLVKPKLIVALGRIAAQRLLNTDEPLARLRGPLHQYGPDRTPLFITYHPAYLLRSPREKAKSWEDLKKVARYLAEHS